MNIQSWIILILVALAVVAAIRIYRKKGTTCSCGGNSSDCTCCSGGSGPCRCSKK